MVETFAFRRFAKVQFRFLLADAADREIWTAAFPLTAAFQPFTVPITAFTVPLDPGEGPFDFERVQGVGFEIFTTPGTAPAFSVNVDDIQIIAPLSDVRDDVVIGFGPGVGTFKWMNDSALVPLTRL